MKFIVSALILFSAFAGIFAQTPATVIKPSVITGDVQSVSDAKIVINSKSGPIEAVLDNKTEYKRVDPANPSLKNATASALSDIGVGDKVMATGVLAADGKSFPARAVYLMTKSDISQKNAKEAELWRTRGITGRVKTVNVQTNQITVEIRGLTATTTLVLTPKPDAKFLRYAPDSIKFSEAKGSTFADIAQGDELRAVGDKSTDGTSFSAEQILSGAFQTIAGTVKSVDAEKNEVVITNLQTKKDITIALGTASIMKRFPAEMAQRLAGGMGGGPGGQVMVRPPGQGGQAAPAAGGQGATPAPGRPGFGGQRPGGGAGGIDDMLERFPNVTAADLKVGDIVALSSTKTANLDRVNAIKFLAGVEPFIRLAQMTSGAGGRNGQGVQAGFSIPGLDGIGFP